MDLSAAIRDEGVLWRIVAMLVALAALADRAATRSYPVRCLVLWLLRPAEAMGWAFVGETAGAQLYPFVDDASAERNSAADALLLAWRFRVLAATLGALLRLARRYSCRIAGFTVAPGVGEPEIQRLSVAPAGSAVPANDTS